MPTVGTPDYLLVTAAPAALGAAVQAQIANGYAPIGVPYPAGANLEQVMFKGAVASFTQYWPIVAVDAVSFTIDGDYTNSFVTGFRFTVSGSTGNDGVYTVDSTGAVLLAGPQTQIPVEEPVPDLTVDGNILDYAPAAAQVNADH